MTQKSQTRKWLWATILLGTLFGRVQVPAGSMDLAAGSEAWLELRSLNFVLATDAGEAAGREALYELEQLRTALPLRDTGALELFYFQDPGQLARFHNRDGFLQDERTGNRAIAAVSSTTALLHEYVHFATARDVPFFPFSPSDRLWVAEGLADYYSTARIESGSLTIGLPYAAALYKLRRGTLLPVAELDRVERDSRYYRDFAARSLFYAESWALVHLLLTTGQPLLADRPGLDAELAAHVASGAPAAVRRVPLLNLDRGKFQVRRIRRPEMALRLTELLPADQRLAALEKLADDDPDFSPSWNRLGIEYLSADRQTEALSAFERAMVLEGPAQSWHLAGLIRLHHFHDFQEGEQLLYRAAAMEPANAEYGRAWQVAREMRQEQEEKRTLALAMSVSAPHALDWPRPAVRLAARKTAPPKMVARRTENVWLFGPQVKILSCSGSGAQRVCLLSR
jgi:tetratricopeptide (TPR) repeat protein